MLFDFYGDILVNIMGLVSDDNVYDLLDSFCLFVNTLLFVK
jgi:hypothetical protein